MTLTNFNMNKKLLYILGLLTVNIIQAQNVHIPDINFKNLLLTSPLINMNGDGDIQISEAIGYSGALHIGNQNISDLTGIEAFVNLTDLFCHGNQLTTLDVSHNTALTYLGCAENQLTTLNVKNGNNSSLIWLYSANNPNLLCIQIDNSNMIGTYWAKDATATYSSDCQSFLATEETVKKSVLTYPNPVKNSLHLSVNADATLYNMIGQKLGSYKNVSQINMEQFVKGTYILVLSDKNGDIIQQTKIAKN